MEKQLITFKVTTKQLFDNYTKNRADMVWEDPHCKSVVDFEKDMITIATANMDGIRRLFMDGMSMFLIPDLVAQIDCADDKDLKEYEVRVYDRLDRLIGVVIDSEIEF